jgi:polyisoprenoid-binding protein YceI
MKRLSMLLLLVLAAGLRAETTHWEIDPSHSTVGFSIRHMMISNVSGSFTKFTGSVDVDPSDPTSAQVKVEIDTASINTGNEKRDDHLRNPDFFDAPKFPKTTFVSKKIEKSGEGLKLTGDLTMHGVTKEVTLDVEGPTQEIKDPYGNQRRGASATGKINRKDWGLTWSKNMDGGGLVLGDEVKLNIEVELVHKPGQPAGTASASPAPEVEKKEAAESK